MGTTFAALQLLILLAAHSTRSVERPDAGTSTPLRSQFDVDCPRGCRCTRTSVECLGTKLHGSNWFLTVRPEAYPNLDTIVVNGNWMGDLAGANLFGANVTNRFVSLANLSGNAITAIDAHTLRGLPALEYLYLYDNRLERVGPDPFRWNHRLRVLDLSNLFSQTVALAERPKLITKLFANSANKFVDLQELIVRDNSLTEIQPDAFCELDGLIRLHLSGNKLKKFDPKSDCLQNLNLLDLSGNDLFTVPATLWNNLQSVTTMDISLNPLVCDCKLSDAIDFLSRSSSSALNQGRTVCAAPKERVGQNIFDMDDLDCKAPHHYVFYLAILVICFCVTFIFVRAYRAHIKLKNLPLIAGYSKLDETEHSGPQFV